MTAWLDRLLGRATMYRLMIYVLGALVVVGAVFTALGLVTPPGSQIYSPALRLAAMAGTLAVLLVWCYLANRVIANLAGVRPHTESTIITALLLFFIFPPTFELLQLAVLALAAIVASVSKYVVVWHRRHIFNPAAFGAFVVGLIGVDYSAWWAGTMWMLPFVALGGLIILYRTRRLLMGAVFLVVAVVAVSIQGVVYGSALADAATGAIGSSAALFLGSFMLSEPLTLPPRRWQLLVIAVVVGALLAVSFSTPRAVVGQFQFGLTSTPELALLIGNLVAFVLARRRGIRLQYTGRRELSPTAWEFEFVPVSHVDFVPGQYLELTVPHRGADARGTRRTFSIASAPTADGPLRLGMRVPAERSSSFKRALLEVPAGARLSATAVAGDFVPHSDPAHPVLYVAAGIGITPFIAHLEHARARGEARDAVLVYSVSSAAEAAYAVELQRTGVRVLLVAPEAVPGMPDNWIWLGAGPLTAELLLGAVPDARDRTTYLSGPPALIASLRSALRRAGARRIRTDAFVGY